MANLSNLELWNYLRDHNPNFKNITSKGTSDLFTERGFEALQRDNINALNDFFTLSMRVAFQRINVASAKNPLETIGLVERYDTPNGGYVQRMAIYSLKPTSPLYKNLQDGSSVDAWKVRKIKADERFFEQNFDYQSYVTLQDFQLKTIFLSEFGISNFVAGVMQSLKNGYIKQSYSNTLDVLNAGIHSEAYPLQDSQNIQLDSWTVGDPTADDLKGFLLTLKDIATMIETSPSTTAFNAGGFDTAYNVDDFVVLVKAGIKNRIALEVELGAFNPETLSVPFEMKEVQNFGGLEAITTDGGGDVVTAYPMYSSVTGEVIGYSLTEGKTGTTPDIVESDVSFTDPNDDIIAIVAQKGLIFENIQNPYSVIPAPYNPAGLYTTYWASSPNNGIVFDYMYGCIVIRRQI